MTGSVHIGSRGGDLPARRFALLATSILTVLAFPQLNVSDSTFRLVSLGVAMSGTLLLMAGLVFLQTTHFAGIMLMPSAGGMFALVELGSRLGAVAVGVVFLAAMASNLITRRCSLNHMMGIDSSDG